MPHRAKVHHKQSREQEDTIAQEIATYCHGTIADSQSAEQRLEAFGVEGLVPLGQALLQEQSRPFLASVQHDVRRAASLVGRILLALGIWGLASYLFNLALSHVDPVGSWWIIALSVLGPNAALGGMLWLLFANENWEEIGKVRLFGRRSVRPLLLKALNRIQASERVSVTAAQRDLLPPLLKNAVLRSDEDLATGVLRVLAQTGTRETIPLVEWVIQRDPKSPADDAIQQAARDTLTVLQERAQARQVANTYLRPASRPVETAVDGLLRPAQGVLPTEEQELLRAVLTDTEAR